MKDWKTISRIVGLHRDLQDSRGSRGHSLVDLVEIGGDANKIVVRADGSLPIADSPPNDIVAFLLSLMKNRRDVMLEVPEVCRLITRDQRGVADSEEKAISCGDR